MSVDPPKVGDVVEHDGRPHVVVVVQRIFTPYTKKDQTTTVIGYTLGLKAIDNPTP